MAWNRREEGRGRDRMHKTDVEEAGRTRGGAASGRRAWGWTHGGAEKRSTKFLSRL